jgi:hypothetical protein
MNLEIFHYTWASAIRTGTNLCPRDVIHVVFEKILFYLLDTMRLIVKIDAEKLIAYPD